jgi:HSP20 family molecular chaperone IbpA
MAFFLPRTVYHSQASSPLYRLLSDVDRFSRRTPEVCYVYRAPAPKPWQPRFDAQETANVFLIRGELPGLTKENITIDFPEPQKMVIRGRLVEGGQDPVPQAAAQPQPAQLEPAQPEPEVPAAPSSPVSETSSRKSFQATVEDSDENDDFDVVSNFSEQEKEQKKPQQPAAPAVQPQAQVQPKPTEQPQPQPKPRQRVVREFTRTYTFPSPVNYDATTADLKDGLLTVVVPKPQKHEPRRIVIN